MAEKFKFPKSFLWGAATSAHQVEGGNHNNWSEWELKIAKTKVQQSAQKIWPENILRKYPNPLQENNYISGRAADHFAKFKEDFSTASSLSHNAHRFSFEWSRIEPQEGKFNEDALLHYDQVINSLKDNGLEAISTIWHWTLPLWLEKKGGVSCSEFPAYFKKFSEVLAKRYSGKIKWWLTINEPDIYLLNSYWHGIWPPESRNFFLFLRARKNLIRSHKKAYQCLKKENKNSAIGIAQNFTYFEGDFSSIISFVVNRTFLRAIKKYQDFIGVNYYFHNVIKDFRFNQNQNFQVSDLGWEIFPKGIYFALKEASRYGLPIIITENGIADVQDTKRFKFIREHIEMVAKAMNEGVYVCGYIYWSLLDNFEWDKGFWPRFGLLDVDYKTFERKIRNSALYFKDVIENGLYLP